MNSNDYIGNELDLFKYAQNWKSYLKDVISPLLKGVVLEVGAGCGTNTCYMGKDYHQKWVCLEPDERLINQIETLIHQGNLPKNCSTVTGTTGSLLPEWNYDTILYIDVLEHIENDANELSRATDHLSPGGHLVVLAPAHQWLMSPFDLAVGHFRRYDMKQLENISPPHLTLKAVKYLDTMGIFASLFNRLFLSSEMPKLSQLIFWDKLLVPVSRKIDPLLGYRTGKSILALWTKKEI